MPQDVALCTPLGDGGGQAPPGISGKRLLKGAGNVKSHQPDEWQAL